MFLVVPREFPSMHPGSVKVGSCKAALKAGSLILARTGLIISIFDPKYHTSHANGTEMSPNQNRTSGNIFISSSFGRVAESSHSVRVLFELGHLSGPLTTDVDASNRLRQRRWADQVRPRRQH